MIAFQMKLGLIISDADHVAVPSKFKCIKC